MSLGNRYRSTTEKSRIHVHVYIKSLSSWHLREPNNPQHLTPSVLTVMKTVKLSSLYCQDKQGILRMNKTSIIMVLRREMV